MQFGAITNLVQILGSKCHFSSAMAQRTLEACGSGSVGPAGRRLGGTARPHELGHAAGSAHAEPPDDPVGVQCPGVQCSGPGGQLQGDGWSPGLHFGSPVISFFPHHVGDILKVFGVKLP